MSDAVPVSLFLARRALCPGCGVPLQLDADSSEATCEWCRETSYVERRLRTVELEIESGIEPGSVARDTAFIPAHSIAATGKAESACPGCGGVIEIKLAQDTATCPNCGSAAKVERRLARAENEHWVENQDNHDLEMFKAGRPRDFEKELFWDYDKLDEEARQDFLDEWNDQRVRILLTTDDADTRFAEAVSIRAWHKVNPWRERMLARLMVLAASSERELELAIAGGPIHYNLYHGEDGENEVRRAVFRAASRALFDGTPSAAVLRELGSAHRGAPVKLLMERLDYSFEHGSFEDAFSALRALSQAMSNAREERHLLGEVMLYRMLYLKAPMLAWVLDQWHKWSIEDRYQSLRFLDDCAVERPDLVPLLRERLGAQQWFETFSSYRKYLEFVDGLVTPLGRQTALHLGVYAPEFDHKDTGFEHLHFALDYLHPLLADPLFERTAIECVNRFVTRLKQQDLPPVHEFIEKHGDALPWRIRQNYLQVCPDSSLLSPFEFQNTYESSETEPNDLQRSVETWQQRFKEARRADKHDESVARYRRRREQVLEELHRQTKQMREEWRRQELQQEQNERDLHEADVADAKQRNHDNWVRDSIRMLEEQAAQQREYHKQYGKESYLKTAENLERQAEKMRRGELPKPSRPWYIRLLNLFRN